MTNYDTVLDYINNKDYTGYEDGDEPPAISVSEITAKLAEFPLTKREIIKVLAKTQVYNIEQNAIMVMVLQVDYRDLMLRLCDGENWGMIPIALDRANEPYYLLRDIHMNYGEEMAVRMLNVMLRHEHINN